MLRRVKPIVIFLHLVLKFNLPLMSFSCLWLECVCLHPLNKEVFQAIIALFSVPFSKDLKINWLLIQKLVFIHFYDEKMISPLNLSLSQQENTQPSVRLASSQALGLFSKRLKDT